MIFPPCVSDEVRWADISRWIAAGDSQPISGALFFAILQFAVRVTASSPEAVLQAMGIATVPVVLGSLWFGYRLMRLAYPGAVFVVLATSSYFWSPLLESRPQQLGQGLVFLGIVFLWRALEGDHVPTRKFWWGWLGILAFTGWFHILSLGILLALSHLLYLVHGMVALTHPPRHALSRLMLGTGMATALVFWPGGPYSATVYALQHDLFPGPMGMIPVLVGLCALAALVLAAAPSIQAHWEAHHPRLRHWFQNNPGTSVMGLTGIPLLLLSFQATLLPDEAWLPYGGSLLRFLLLQSGNLFFLGLCVAGVGMAIRGGIVPTRSVRFPLPEVMVPTLGLLAVLALGTSSLMAHTNWMLRILSYGLPFIAPIGAAVLMESRYRIPLLTVAFVLAVVSLMAALQLGLAGACGG